MRYRRLGRSGLFVSDICLAAIEAVHAEGKNPVLYGAPRPRRTVSPQRPLETVSDTALSY